MKSKRAVRVCGEWLAACLRMGWDRKDLDRLEDLWWQWHDDEGRLLPEPRKAT